MRIGTRGSELALWQARRVRALLREVAGVEAELVVIKTAGDHDLHTPLGEMTGKRFFTKEIEDALLAGEIDVAVHSLKDLQTVMPKGLMLGAVPERADRRDILLTRREAFTTGHPLRLWAGAKVGTSSARRVAQLRFLRPDLVLEPLRGNVPTRVRKLREGQYDAILVAAAGLDRLELPVDDFHVYRLPEALVVPAPGQGALGLQIRENDDAARHVVAKLDSAQQRASVNLEREVLRHLEGGCQLALGTAADITANGYRLALFLGDLEGQRPRRIVVSGTAQQAVVDAAVAFAKCAPRNSTVQPLMIWITREAESASDFASELDTNRFVVEAIPVASATVAGDPEHQKRTMENLHVYDWVMFTSQSSVREFKRLMDAYGVAWDARTQRAAVGKKTAGAMAKLEWSADFVGDVADAGSLAQQFISEQAGPVGKVLFPCGRLAGSELEAGLATLTAHFERLVCYDMIPHPQLKSAVRDASEPGAIVFTSQQAARLLLAERPALKNTMAVSIGPATSEVLLSLGCTLVYEALDRSLEGTAEVIDGLFAT